MRTTLHPTLKLREKPLHKGGKANVGCVQPYTGLKAFAHRHFRRFRWRVEGVTTLLSKIHYLYNHDDMPKRVEQYVRDRLIASHCRTYYYEYRNGERLISPAIQQEIRRLFQEAGWTGEVVFDSYIEDYNW